MGPAFQAVICAVLSRVRLFVIPWTVARQAPLSMGFSRQEYWSGLPLPSPGDLPDPGIKPVSLVSPLKQRATTKKVEPFDGELGPPGRAVSLTLWGACEGLRGGGGVRDACLNIRGWRKREQHWQHLKLSSSMTEGWGGVRGLQEQGYRQRWQNWEDSQSHRTWAPPGRVSSTRPAEIPRGRILRHSSSLGLVKVKGETDPPAILKTDYTREPPS